MPLPAPRLDQYDPRCLHEQDAQVAVPPLRYLAEDSAVAGRDLLRYEAQPGGKVTAFGERITGPDCGYHGAGDKRSDAGNAHQPLAPKVLPRKGCDLVRLSDRYAHRAGASLRLDLQ
jgi:hypothetical protein